MISNGAMMADVIPAPEDHVVADPREGLDGVVLQDEAILADGRSPEERGPAAHVADEAVATFLPLAIDPLTASVHPLRRHRREEVVLGGGKVMLQLLEWHDGLTFEDGLGGEILPRDREGVDLASTVMRQVEVRQRGEVPEAEDDHAGHRLGSR